MTSFGPRAVEIEIVADRRAISDGEHTLVIINIGANPHTDENLIAWLPSGRIAFQGDLLYYAEGRPYPPSGRGTMNDFFRSFVDEHGIRPLAVYGVDSRGRKPCSSCRRRHSAEGGRLNAECRTDGCT